MKNKIKAGTLSLVFVVLNTLTLYPQEPLKMSTLKLYSNLSVTNTEPSRVFPPSVLDLRNEVETRVGYFTPAFVIGQTNGNFHEMELPSFLLNRKNIEEKVYNSDSTDMLVLAKK